MKINQEEQEQGAVPVSDRREMIAERHTGKRFCPCPSEGMDAFTPMTHSVQGTDFAPLQSVGASTSTTYGAQEFYSESMGVHPHMMY